MPRTVWLTPFPVGVPARSGGFGLFKNTPGYLPVQLVFRDWDLFWVLSGGAAWKLADGRALEARAGEFALLPPFTPVDVFETEPNLSFHYCHFTMRPLPTFAAGDALIPDYAGPGTQARLPLTFSVQEAPGVTRAYRALRNLPPQGAPWRFERGLIELIAELAEFAVARTASAKGAKTEGAWLEPNARLDQRVETLCKKIDADPARAWTVGELAADANLSPSHLHALCSRALGKSLKRYIVEARLREALRLLKERPNGELPAIWEVAEACGFSSQHFFARQFKTHFRLTPLQYRNGAPLET